MRLLFAAFALLFTSAAFAGQADKKLDIYWVDVEGGGATLLVTPAGESILIDCGNPGGRDAGRVHKVATEVAGLKQIDFLVTTHYHIDHFGGAAELAALMPIRNVYDNGEFATGRERPSKAYLEFKAEKRVVYNPGDKLPVKNLDDPKSPKLTIQCLVARQQPFEPQPEAKPDDANKPRRKAEDYSDNANSIAQLISFGDFRLYVGGDLTWNIEEKLAYPKNLVGKIDLYQVTHHGLDVSNNPALVKAMEPTVAVFPNGPTKGCMPETFGTIKTTDSVVGIYQLHRNQRPNEEKNNVPDEFIANPAKDCQGNHVRCAVEPDAKSFTMTVPATKHEQKFETKAK